MSIVDVNHVTARNDQENARSRRGVLFRPLVSRMKNENMKTQMLVEQELAAQLKLEDKPPKSRQITRFADLAGAEPFPMQGCEKFVLKPLGFDAESMLSSSLWSDLLISFLLPLRFPLPVLTNFIDAWLQKLSKQRHGVLI